MPVHEARQVRGQQREGGKHREHRRAARAAGMSEHGARRRDERGRDGVVEEVGEARRIGQAAERGVGMQGPDRHVDERPREEEREPEQRQADPAQQHEERLAGPGDREPVLEPLRRAEQDGGPGRDGGGADADEDPGQVVRQVGADHAHRDHERRERREPDRAGGQPARALGAGRELVAARKGHRAR
jgi:hypothetical protein